MKLYDLALGPSTLLALAVAVGSVLALPSDEAPARVVVTDTETTILDVVEFVPGTATLRPGSLLTLDAVADTLRGNPSIELVEVQSHTAGKSDDAASLDLSQQRADVVATYIEARGVAPDRLEAQGYGNTQPIDVTAPAKNERMAFLILKRTSDTP